MATSPLADDRLSRWDQIIRSRVRMALMPEASQIWVKAVPLHIRLYNCVTCGACQTRDPETSVQLARLVEPLCGLGGSLGLVLGLDMHCHGSKRTRKHCYVIGQSYDRNYIWNRIYRRDQIDQPSDDNALGPDWCVRVLQGIIHGESLFDHFTSNSGRVVANGDPKGCVV